MTRQQIADRVATAVLWAAGILILLILAGFLLPILIEGLPVVDWQFLTTRSSAYRAGGGVGAQLFNTIYITGLSLLFSLPVGVGAGIYMAEYAKPGRMTDLIRLSVEALASVPSIVLGLFGMILFVNYMGWGFTILGGSLSLALLNLPVLVRNTEEAVRAVPQSYREGSLGLGATQWQTISRVVLPSALPGILTGLTLVAGRALGETAVLIYTAGVTASRHFPNPDLMIAGETLAVRIWSVTSEGLVPDADRIAMGASALLILLVLFVNFLIALPLYRYRRRMR
ncbi:phosphate ABC transporter permease PstA [Symbiobacterium thermophilum]|uniref:Phosphate transport system permease protein PstA n=2 Tax=Symbiobacterium thermophilum TaxID=2734 RepID=Q67RG1_SYMTH|nr:phosphate ABC transporter permease PstA [Symbiobacterium thermophilum]MBY6277641.1 phosphate ABC transporter, permease protein PstA [Symbiobacterium thermophilum]BAD39732.1 phosphate ABC transporter permease protein [Symbiobacterium thermophilum IAM 14863]